MIDEKQQKKIYEEIVKDKNGINYKSVEKRQIDNMRMVEIVFTVVYYSQMTKLLDIAKNNNAIFLIEAIESFNVKIILH